MKAVLSQIALIIGGVLSAMLLVINLSRGMDLLTAAFRAVMVFIVTVTLIFVFLRLFATIVVRFVAEQVMKQGAATKQEADGGTAPAGRRSRIAAPPKTESRE